MGKAASSVRTWGIVVVILIVIGVAAYVVGTQVERSATEVQTSKATLEVQTAKAKIASLQSVNQLLEANLWAYRAAAALDNRNFGVANNAIIKAAGDLQTVDASAAGLNVTSVSALQKEASGIKISVAADLGVQRAEVMHLASGISALLGKTVATP